MSIGTISILCEIVPICLFTHNYKIEIVPILLIQHFIEQ
jgi:hypothetical protein